MSSYINKFFGEWQDEEGNRFDKEFVLYYKDTEEPNGLELQIDIKKHNKKAFFEAIELQLMYLPNIVFTSKKEGAMQYEDHDVSAKIVYKDSNIVISDNKVLDKPHILLGTGAGLINYGAIEFSELELEPKRGAVGLILDINNVEVTPSRESVIWSPKTRNAIINSYNKVVDTATSIINDELQGETDYLAWIQKAATIKTALTSTGDGNQSVLQKLAGIIDSSAVNKIFFTSKGFTKLFSSDMDKIVGKKLLVRTFEYDKYARKIVRTKVKNVNSLANYPIYITDDKSDKYVDRYIYSELAKGTFVQIKKLAGWDLEKTSNLIGNSTIIKDYTKVVVPDDIMDKYILEESDNGFVDDEDGSATATVIDPNRLARIRKQNQEIIYHAFNYWSGSNIVYSAKTIKFMDIADEFTSDVVVYGTSKDRDQMDSVIGLIPSAWFRPHSTHAAIAFLTKVDPVSFIQISEENLKYVKDHSKFIYFGDWLATYKHVKLVFNDMIKWSVTMSKISSIESNLDHYYFNVNKIEDLNEAPKLVTLIGKEYVILGSVFRHFHNNSSSGSLNTFIAAASKYHIGKVSNADVDNTGYLDMLNDEIPEALCHFVDKIDDVDIVFTEFIDKYIEYNDYFKPYAKIINEFSSYYWQDRDTYKLLSDLIHAHRTPIKPAGFFDGIRD